MLNRINVFKIIKDHLKTLRSNNSDSQLISRGDFLLFLAAPLIVACVLTYKQVALAKHITDLITAVSILGGFLFNFLAIIYGLMDKLKVDSEDNSLKKRFVKEIHVNISFNILISFLLIILLVSYSYQPADTCRFIFIDYLFSIVIYFFLFLFTLTMIMILNRVYIIMKKESD